MGKGLKDVEHAYFSQIVYLHWDKLEEYYDKKFESVLNRLKNNENIIIIEKGSKEEEYEETDFLNNNEKMELNNNSDIKDINESFDNDSNKIKIYASDVMKRIRREDKYNSFVEYLNDTLIWNCVKKTMYSYEEGSYVKKDCEFESDKVVEKPPLDDIEALIDYEINKKDIVDIKAIKNKPGNRDIDWKKRGSARESGRPMVLGEIKIFHEEDKRVFAEYTEDEEATKEDPRYKYNFFDDWKYVDSKRGDQLAKYYHNINMEDNGFFAATYQKGEDILLIAYRGTEPLTGMGRFKDGIDELKKDMRKFRDTLEEWKNELSNTGKLIRDIKGKIKNILDMRKEDANAFDRLQYEGRETYADSMKEEYTLMKKQSEALKKRRELMKHLKDMDKLNSNTQKLISDYQEKYNTEREGFEYLRQPGEMKQEYDQFTNEINGAQSESKILLESFFNSFVELLIYELSNPTETLKLIMGSAIGGYTGLKIEQNLLHLIKGLKKGSTKLEKVITEAFKVESTAWLAVILTNILSVFRCWDMLHINGWISMGLLLVDKMNLLNINLIHSIFGIIPTDFRVDFELGFLNQMSDQLYMAAKYYDYVCENYGEGKTIYITGHSLGGCLAQSAYVYSGKKHETVTWNALGFGYKNYWSWNLPGLEMRNLQLMANKEYILERKNIKKRYEEAKGGTFGNYYIHGIDAICKNFYNKKDWTACLKTKVGIQYEMMDGTEEIARYGNDMVGKDSKWRMLTAHIMPDFTHHGVNDFIQYMGDDGMIIVNGNFNETHKKNTVKSTFKYLMYTNIHLRNSLLGENAKLIKITEKLAKQLGLNKIYIGKSFFITDKKDVFKDYKRYYKMGIEELVAQDKDDKKEYGKVESKHLKKKINRFNALMREQIDSNSDKEEKELYKKLNSQEKAIHKIEKRKAKLEKKFKKDSFGEIKHSENVDNILKIESREIDWEEWEKDAIRLTEIKERYSAEAGKYKYQPLDMKILEEGVEKYIEYKGCDKSIKLDDELNKNGQEIEIIGYYKLGVFENIRNMAGIIGGLVEYLFIVKELPNKDEKKEPKEKPVIEGMKLRCSNGSCISEIGVKTQSCYYIDNKLVATVKDKPKRCFGKCASQNGEECKLKAIIENWDKGSEVLEIEGNNTLLSTAKLRCSLGGIITIEDSNDLLKLD